MCSSLPVCVTTNTASLDILEHLPVPKPVGKTIFTGRTQDFPAYWRLLPFLPFLTGQPSNAVESPGRVKDTEVMGFTESFTADLSPDGAALCISTGDSSRKSTTATQNKG